MSRLAEAAAAIVRRVEGQPRLDRPGYRVEHGVALVLNLLGNASQPVRNLLHGTWLGHPLHPVLTDVPVGAWTAAAVLDGVDAFGRATPGTGSAAEITVAVGLVGAAGAAVTGVTDWQHTQGNARRLGLVHGIVNSVVLTVYAASWLERRRGRHGRGRALAALGYALLQASAYAGGDLVFRQRIGVDHADRSLEPREFVPVLAEAELEEDLATGVVADGVGVVLVRSGGRVHALGSRCAHLGGPLSEGIVSRGAIACPWHGSRYDLATGEVIDGPATLPLPCFETRLRAGRVEVRRRPPVPGAAPGAVLAREQERADARH